jgi:hypothetical protein
MGCEPDAFEFRCSQTATLFGATQTQPLAVDRLESIKSSIADFPGRLLTHQQHGPSLMIEYRITGPVSTLAEFHASFSQRDSDRDIVGSIG